LHGKKGPVDSYPDPKLINEPKTFHIKIISAFYECILITEGRGKIERIELYIRIQDFLFAVPPERGNHDWETGLDSQRYFVLPVIIRHRPALVLHRSKKERQGNPLIVPGSLPVLKTF
jgi:hypothetical protein